MEPISIQKLKTMLKQLNEHPELTPILRLPNGDKITTDVETVQQEITEYIINQDETGYKHTVETKIDAVQNNILILVMPIVEAGWDLY